MIRNFLAIMILVTSIGVTKLNAQNNVIIYNNCNINIPFQLSYDNMNWSSYYTLGPTMYSNYPLGTAQCFYIYLPTFDPSGTTILSFVNYQLCSPNRYQIYWNIYNGRLDVMPY